MIEFSFNVKLQFRDAQAFNDEEPQRAHDRLNKKIFEALVAEFPDRSVIVEVEPI